jgi:long-chain acyl-CoA synthetase
MLDLRHTLRRPLKECPKSTAALCGDLKLSYEQLYERSMRLANGLLSLGLKRGDRVAVLMLNCHRFLELYYGTMFARLVIVPLNIRWGAKEFAYALSDCQPKVFVLDATIYEHLKPYIEQLKLLGVENFLFAAEEAPEGMIAYEKLLKRASSEDPNIEVDEDDLVGLFYTSGTTGNPKGVMLTHKNLMMNAYHAQISFDFSGESTYLHAAPMFHLADGAGTFTVSWNGGTHAFVPRFDPEDVLKTIEAKRVTTVTLIPTMINWLLSHPGVERFDLSSLSQILYGASPMPVERLKQAMEAFECRFQQGYGMTEAAPLVTVLSAEDHKRAISEGREEILASAGKPIPGVEVRIVDEGDRDVEPGQIGEILVRGPNIMKGYWNRPQETEEALRGGWYHSKDMARLDEEGYIYIVDRKDDMIITGGENVYSTEVETVLYEHPAVLEAAVIGVPDEKWIQAIKAVVVLREGHRVIEQELIDFCREHLSRYKVPKSVDFVEELPKGGTGKILKSVLREKYRTAAKEGKGDAD